MDSSRPSSACFQLGGVLCSAVIEAGAVGPHSLMMAWVWAASTSLCHQGLSTTLGSCAIIVPVVQRRKWRPVWKQKSQAVGALWWHWEWSAWEVSSMVSGRWRVAGKCLR